MLSAEVHQLRLLIIGCSWLQLPYERERRLRLEVNERTSNAKTVSLGIASNTDVPNGYGPNGCRPDVMSEE
jgi:hypothetical protein